MAAGERGNENRSALGAAMAAIVLFTRTLAKEVGQFGIRANCLSPVAVTEALQQGLTAQAERQGIALEGGRSGHRVGGRHGSDAFTGGGGRRRTFPLLRCVDRHHQPDGQQQLWHHHALTPPGASALLTALEPLSTIRPTTPTSTVTSRPSA